MVHTFKLYIFFANKSMISILEPLAEGRSGSEIGLGGAKTSLDNFLLR